MHSPTLLTVATLLMAVMFTAMLAVWRFNRGIPGLQAWALSYLLGFVSAVLVLVRDGISQSVHHPGWAAATLVCLFLSAYASLAGARAFMGQRPLPPTYPLGGAALLCGVAFYFTEVQASLGARVLAGSSLAGLMYVASAQVYWSAGLRGYPARTLVACASLVHGGFLLLRPWLFRLGSTSDAPDLASRLSHIVIIETTLALILMAFGILMLVNEHVTGELRRMAERDFLTGVFNRRAFLGQLEKAGSLAQRSQSALPVLLVDLDHFKQINDKYGHRTGDEVLRHFVNVAEACLRKHDVLGRMGGEEFAVFLPQTDREDAQRVTERLRSLVAAQPLMSERGPVSLTVSIGLAMCQPGEPTENALHRADQAMYQAKASGRNQVVSLVAVGA